MAKHCFVISPIGVAGSPEREHADDVFDFIIKPAMDELGIVPYRADHSQQIGRITDQMIGSILSDDLCIAILTFHNPNVFYELAIAQSAARPVIILIERGQTIPFDIRDLRAIEYDLRPRPLRDKVYVRQIVENVRNLEATNWAAEVPFGNHLSPLGSRRDELEIHEKAEDFGNSDRWIALVRSTSNTLELSGLSLRWWLNAPQFPGLMKEKAQAGCKIRLLLMHEENTALSQYVNDSTRIGGIEHLTAELKGTYALFTQFALNQPNIQVRRMRTGFLHQQIVKTDDKMVVTLVLYGGATARFPLLDISATSPLYRTMAAEFDHLWNLNETN